MPKMDEGGKTKPTTKQKSDAKKRAAAKPPKPKGTMTAHEFAVDQLRKAGVTPAKGAAAIKQFERLNHQAALKRQKLNLGRAATVGRASSLTAGTATVKTTVKTTTATKPPAKKKPVAKPKKKY